MERIALYLYPCGLVATRDKLTLVRGGTKEELIANMYKAAPDVKVVYVFTQSPTYSFISDSIDALKAVGYKNIKLVNATSWFNTELMQRSPVKLVVGECVALWSNEPSAFTIYQKTNDGYAQVCDNASYAVTNFDLCPTLKHVIVLSEIPASEKAAVKNMFRCQTVHFIGNKGRSWLKCIWDEYDEKVENFLPALFTLNLRFKYGNYYHLEKVHYSQLPFKKTFKLDIDNAVELEPFVEYSSFLQPESLKTHSFEAGKSRVLKITLTVGFEFIPEVAVTIASELDTTKGVVYGVDFVHNANEDSDGSDDDNKSVDNGDYFTGTLITSDGAVVVVERSNDISDVFTQLEAQKGSAKLRGVFVDYPGHDSFPLDTHRVVINALPSPKTKVCVGRTHSDWAIHLRNSGIKLKVGEYVVIANFILQCSEEYFLFVKTKHGFQIVGKCDKESVDLPADTVLVILNKMEYGDAFKNFAAIRFPSKKVVYSEQSKLPKNFRHDFAWQYFNGMDFYGYMIRPYRGVFFKFFNGRHSYNIESTWSYNCGTYENRIARLLKLHSGFERHPFFDVSAHYVGYKGDANAFKIPMPETNFIHLKISLDDKLIPTVTYTKANSPLFPVAKRSKKVAKKQKNALENQNDIANHRNKAAAVSDPDVPKVCSVKSISDGLAMLNVTNAAAIDGPPETSVSKTVSVKTEVIHQNKAVVSKTAKSAIRYVTPGTSSCVVNEVVLTFTKDNQVLIDGGPAYTGVKEIPAYLRLKYTKGTPQFLVGAKAKETTRKSRKHLIYDVPGLLAAYANPDRENPAWTFDTERNKSGALVIHLNTNDRTFPVVVFGHIVLAVIERVCCHLRMEVNRIGIRLPSEASVSEEDLTAISERLKTELVLL